jgi:hypothetical protein
MVSGTRTVFSMRALMFGLILALLATTFGATALMAQSSDATSSALQDPRHPAVDNTSRTVDFTVTSSTNASLVSAIMDLGPKSHGCEVTASAEVDRTVDGTGVYVFSIGLDSTTSTTSSERRIEFVSTADQDVIWENAATSQGYDSLSGSHTFNFLVRKDSAGFVNTTVTNATISVVCANAQL